MDRTAGYHRFMLSLTKVFICLFSANLESCEDVSTTVDASCNKNIEVIINFKKLFRKRCQVWKKQQTHARGFEFTKLGLKSFIQTFLEKEEEVEEEEEEEGGNG